MNRFTLHKVMSKPPTTYYYDYDYATVSIYCGVCYAHGGAVLSTATYARLYKSSRVQ